LAILLEEEINAAVRVGTAAPGDGIAELAVSEGDQLFELEPV